MVGNEIDEFLLYYIVEAIPPIKYILRLCVLFVHRETVGKCSDEVVKGCVELLVGFNGLVHLLVFGDSPILAIVQD